MSTFMAKKETAERTWYVIDATDQVVGRLAVVVANILRGKHKPTYTPHCDVGDFVIVVNADKVKFTGRKWDSKEYKSYTGYTSGQRIIPAKEMLRRRPTDILKFAVKRMIPKGPQGYAQLAKLKLYAGPQHDQQAQQPAEFKMPARKAKA